jgi:hypothetical protein
MAALAATLFQERRKRFDDAVRLEVPDRVQVEIHFGYFPAKYLCISGNVPARLLALGSPIEVREVAKKLIDYCGRDGGFAMSSRTPVDDARTENLKALIDFTKEYGTYA